MPQVKELNLQYITNPSGEKTAVILPMVEFQELVEDLADLAAVAERRAEPTVSHDQLVEDYFEFEDDAIRIKGHRIWLEHVLEYYLSGYAPEEIAREFPGLSLDKVYAAI